jgi:SEFIR domain/NPCBM/NEW2 domain
MSDREAPRVFITYAHDSPVHEERVQQFAEFLRAEIGLDAHLDVWYDHGRIDWSAWAIEQLASADFILVIASPEYKIRADGAAPSHVGRGSQFESAIIRDNMTKDLRGEIRRVLPVVFPERSIDDIPTFLHAYSTTRYQIPEFTEAGVAGLLAAITGHGRYPMPERGEWRGGAASAPAPASAQSTPQRVLLANRLLWARRTSEVYSGVAWIDGVRYDNSIILRPTQATTRPREFVEVDVGQTYRRMTATVGVLDDATEAFQVGHFRVYLDGNLQQVHRVARGRPAAVEVDVTSALRLRLEMYRPDTIASPLMSGGLMNDGRSSRLPELAWGDPVLS